MKKHVKNIKFKYTLYFTAVHGGNSPPVIEISNGWLQGTLQKSYNGRVYSSFQGIPYARPPIGDLRFEAPKEPYNWTGTWIANTKHSCMYNTGSEITGDEDCLYLNVYVPRETPDPADNLNIIVHIHAGGMLVWDSTFYAGAKYLMDEEVILVTMNYRLGALGFFSTDDDVVPGNNGLKDQVLSLKWIQKNIRYFGGNPESVMLTGMSAGSVSVHLHYFSPLSRGLFHKGVSQSGTALHPLIPQKSASQSAKQLGEMLGCPTDNSKHLRDCLRTRSAKTIIVSQKSFLPSDASQGPTFGPVIEIPSDGAFLIEHPYKLLIDKNIADVPWIVGTNEEEGSFVVHRKKFNNYFSHFYLFILNQMITIII
ncbi:carboxylesterase [Holotrichia oblita]|uniref:Carboxylesterase n=1 Tax=Holotrichia oblita TaxID=644536 RepID=A0ACB9ST13_HOLOL|nr:carboxylesterase [Holotrichia oblita]